MNKPELPPSEDQLRFIRCYELSSGNVLRAAERANVGRRTVYNWMKQPAFQSLMEDANQTFCDFVEGKLLERIKANNTRAIIFYCKTRLKHRGYGL